jgi:hypothetical protein
VQATRESLEKVWQDLKKARGFVMATEWTAWMEKLQQEGGEKGDLHLLSTLDPEEFAKLQEVSTDRNWCHAFAVKLQPHHKQD